MRVLQLVLQSFFVLVLAIAPAHAQSVGATIPVGTSPAAIAVNPVTNKVYVANEGSNTVTIINGATNFPSSITAGVRPTWIGVNPETNKIYVSNFGSPPNMMVINGVSDTVSTTMTMGDVGWIAINPVTNKIYALRYGNGDEVNIVLDERYVNTAATRSYTPVSIALNPYTNILYIVHQTTGDLTAIDASVDQSVNPDNAFNYPPLLCPNGTAATVPVPARISTATTARASTSPTRPWRSP
jgi:YVTN family beta-propeller protein